MIAGYLTFKELEIITGFKPKYLKQLILNGLEYHELDIQYDMNNLKIDTNLSWDEMLFSIDEVERWLKVHIF